MLASAALVTAPAPAHQVEPGSELPPAMTSPVPETPVDELWISEVDLRMTVPASIAGSTPWPFVIDTGSERTVVSAELARRLGLPPGPVRRVTTMAGTAPAATALVPDLRVGPVLVGAIEAPVFSRRNLGAIGMLGIDALQGHKVSIDFHEDTMALVPARKNRRPRARADEILVIAKSLYGQLIVTDAHWRGRKIAVVIDTGSPLTVGNPPLLALGRKPPPPLGKVTMIAVNGVAITAESYLLERLEIGGVRFSGVSVAIADLAPFRRFGLEDRPALLLGMDTLRMFRAIDIDFANRTIVMRLPRDARTDAAAR